MHNNANLHGLNPGCWTKIAQGDECAFALMNLLPFPHLTERQWCRSGLVSLLHGIFERENNLCKSSAFFSGITPELAACAAQCPSTDRLQVTVRSIWALCNVFHLSSSQSATFMYSQTLSLLEVLLWCVIFPLSQ